MTDAELRELDADIHRAMTGENCGWGFNSIPGDLLDRTMRVFSTSAPVPSYSTDIAAAWQMVEKMVAMEKTPDGKEIDVEMVRNYGMRRWFFSFRSGTGEYAETIPLAICLAVLTAVYGKTPTTEG